MQRRIPIKAKASAVSFEEIASEVVDEIYSRIKCRQFVVFSLYSKKLTDALSVTDRNKAVYIFDVNKFAVDGVEKDKKVIRLGAKPEELPPITEEVAGAIAFFDATEPNRGIQGFHGLIKTCKGFSNFVVLLPPKMEGLPLNDDRWRSYVFNAKGQNVQLFENLEVTDCSAAIEIAEQIYESSPDINEEPVPTPEPEPEPVKRRSSKRDSSKPPRSPSGKVDAFSPEISQRSYKEVIDSFPAPHQGKGYEPLTAEWEDDFMKYIESLVNIYVPNLDPRITSQLFTDDKRPIWIRAFTSSSYNFNNDSNYESLEFVGDKTLESCFKYYMVAREPNMSEYIGNNRQNNYLSKNLQMYTGKKMEFLKWVIHKGEFVPDKMAEDIMESWAGALQIVGDLIVNGMGYILVRKYIENIFDRVDWSADEQYDYQDSIQISIQFLKEKLKWPIEPIHEVDAKGINHFRMTVSGDNYIKWMTRFYTDLSLDFKKIPLKIVVKSSDQSKDVARKMLFDDLINRLTELGITRAMITSQNFFNSSLSEDPKIRPVAEAVLEKARAVGVVQFMIKDAKYMEQKDGSIQTIVGILPNGRFVNLFTKYYPTGNIPDSQRKLDLMERYLRE